MRLVLLCVSLMCPTLAFPEKLIYFLSIENYIKHIFNMMNFYLNVNKQKLGRSTSRFILFMSLEPWDELNDAKTNSWSPIYKKWTCN